MDTREPQASPIRREVWDAWGSQLGVDAAINPDCGSVAYFPLAATFSVTRAKMRYRFPSTVGTASILYCRVAFGSLLIALATLRMLLSRLTLWSVGTVPSSLGRGANSHSTSGCKLLSHSRYAGSKLARP